MNLSLQQSDDFWADLLKHVDWYREHAAPEIAERFVDTVEATLDSLRRTPGLGRQRFVTAHEICLGDYFSLHSSCPAVPMHRLQAMNQGIIGKSGTSLVRSLDVLESYGQRYGVDFDANGPKGQSIIRGGWIVRQPGTA